MSQSLSPKRRRKTSPVRSGGGMTLVELLAVIVIMTLLAAAALPIIAPAMQNRQVREASRIVNSFLSGARNRAMQTGRPVGVAFQRMPGLPEACVTMSYAEVPLPYSGDSLVSMVQLGPATTIGGVIYGTLTSIPDVGWVHTVRAGDLIKFNYIGNTYQLVGTINPSNNAAVPGAIDNNGYYTVAGAPSPGNCAWTFICVSSTDPNVYNASIAPVKYQIFRAPIRSAAGSVQLPGTAVIDLTCSGFDNGVPLVDSGNGSPLSPWISTQTFQPIGPTFSSGNVFVGGAAVTDPSSVVLTFGPSGAVDRLWCWQNPIMPAATTGYNPVPMAIRPTQPIHLMVGRRELLPLPTTPPAITDPNANGFVPYLNWQDLGNYWVTISPQSGLVTTTEVVIPSAPFPPSGAPYGTANDLLGSRQLARQGQAMGGR